ncbi:MAG: sporulation protein YqfD [Ruminococcaceae bacterium]|nr:sporulation protein YqfD [Oscillospiraceae bacterium]
MMGRIYNYFTGYVTVRVKTNQPERFLNIAVINNIYLWDLKKISENEMTFNVSPKGFKKLRKIVWDVKSKVKIIKKSGFFILRRKISAKKIIFIGLIPATLIIIFLSSLILDIKITGNETVKTELILEKLSEINLQKFKLRGNIDSEKISVKLINDIDEISWVGVYEKGTKLHIEIKERDMPPEMVKKDIPCHIIARKDGIIKKINVTNGEKMVAENEVVTKGQLLVSGIINTQFDGIRYVHSMAEVTANTWWENFLSVKLYEYKKSYTGKQTKKVFVKFLNNEFELTKKVVPYYNYDETPKRFTTSLFEIKAVTYDEYTLVKTTITEEEAIKRGKEALLCELYKNFDNKKVKDTQFDITVTDEETRNIRILANIYEDIGKQVVIKKEE